MSEHEDFLAEQLGPRRAVATRPPDWEDVRRRARRSRRPLVAVVAGVAALALGAGALAETVGSGFDDWIAGTLGRPLSGDERRVLDEENRRSIAPLPGDTEARELIVAERNGKTYRLLALNTGAAVCLKLAGSDPDEGGDVYCVSARELERSGEPAVPLRVDGPLHESTPGGPPSDVATYGIVAAETRRVVLETEGGRREAEVENGAFLSISRGGRDAPSTVGAYAVEETGARRPVAIAPPLGADVDRYVTGLPVRGPERVERRVSGGRIAWLERREERGDPVPERLRRYLGSAWRLGDFLRLVRPDPDDYVSFAVGVDTTTGAICEAKIARGGVGGGCNPAETLFARLPFSPGWEYAGVGVQFLSVQGIASDDVERMLLFLGNGEVRPVGLRDNVFFARVPRAKLPAKLVAYDREGRVIGIETRRSG